MTRLHLLNISLLIVFSQQVSVQSESINNRCITENKVSGQAHALKYESDSYPKVLFVGNSIMGPVYDLFIADNEPYLCTNNAHSGDGILDQLTAWNNLSTEQKQSFDYILLEVGINSITSDAVYHVLYYQQLITQINEDKKAGCKIIAATLTPAGGSTLGMNYEHWLELNAAIRGEGPNPITGIDVVMTTNTTGLDKNSDWHLDAEFEKAEPDHVHPNAAGYKVIKENYIYAIENNPINPINQAPVVVNDAYEVAEGGTLTRTAPGLLQNDSDQESDPLTAYKVTNPSHGTVTLNTNGSFSYLHDGSDTTNDTFTYRAYDGVNYSNNATVTITVTSIPDPPDPPDTSIQAIPPKAPSSLKAYTLNEKYISLSWLDNSKNEQEFVISKHLISNPNNSIQITLYANNTSYLDSIVAPGYSYGYSVKAVNMVGSSDYSEEFVVATPSIAETKRIKEGLIAYYNFGYNPELVIYDVSGDGDPVDLRLTHPSQVDWHDNGQLTIGSNTLIESVNSAKKIIDELKETNEITIECWIRPAEPDFPGKGRILSLGNDEDNIGFVLNQEYVWDSLKKSLIYSSRLNTEFTDSTGYPELVQYKRSSTFINTHHLVYVRNKQGQESIYLNGVKSAEAFRPGDLSSWNDNFYLRLGNETDLQSPWKGSFYLVAIYKNALKPEEILKNYSVGPRDQWVQELIEYDISCFPNPFHDLTTFKILPQYIPDVAAPTSIRIVNPYGITLFEEELFDPTMEYIKPFDFSGFPKGLYFLQVISGEKRVSLKLINY